MYVQYIYKEYWRAGFDHDAWVAEWPLKPLYVNPPFTQTKSILVKCAIHYYQGRNIILLIPTRSLDTHDLWQDVLKDCTVAEHYQRVKFDGYKDYLREGLSIIYMIQPEVLEKAVFAKKQVMLSKNRSNIEKLEDRSMKWGPKDKNLNEKDIVDDYLRLKLIRKVMSLYSITHYLAKKIIDKHIDYEAKKEEFGVSTPQIK